MPACLLRRSIWGLEPVVRRYGALVGVAPESCVICAGYRALTTTGNGPTAIPSRPSEGPVVGTVFGLYQDRYPAKFAGAAGIPTGEDLSPVDIHKLRRLMPGRTSGTCAARSMRWRKTSPISHRDSSTPCSAEIGTALIDNVVRKSPT